MKKKILSKWYVYYPPPRVLYI